GQSLRQRFLLLGSVPLFGFCSAHLSRKSPRYRSLSSRSATQALSYGFPGTGFSQHAGPRQRAPRLADLRRFRSCPDCRRSRPLPRRAFRSGVVRDGVCLGLHDHRFVPVAFPVGKIPPPQERGETAHAAGSAGQHSDQCLCDRRPSSRRQHSGPVASRSRSVLLARSRLCGLRSIKQHLLIIAFYGTCENAVKAQVWVALSVYVLVAIVKKQLGLDLSLYKILQILSVTVFEKTPILEGFSNFSDEITGAEPCI